MSFVTAILKPWQHTAEADQIIIVFKNLTTVLVIGTLLMFTQTFSKQIHTEFHFYHRSPTLSSTMEFALWLPFAVDQLNNNIMCDLCDIYFNVTFIKHCVEHLELNYNIYVMECWKTNIYWVSSKHLPKLRVPNLGVIKSARAVSRNVYRICIHFICIDGSVPVYVII